MRTFRFLFLVNFLFSSLFVLSVTGNVAEEKKEETGGCFHDGGCCAAPETEAVPSANYETDALEALLDADDDAQDTPCASFLKDMKRYEVDGPPIDAHSDDWPSWTSKNFVPVFLIPSLAGTRLRTWSRLDCGIGPSLSHFHVGGAVWLDLKRMMVQTKCWINCMKLNPETQENDECMTRPDEGIDAVTQVDETLPAGFLLKSLIHMLSSKGYEPEQSMFAHPYDWRLPPRKLEERDAAFSRLKWKIEGTVAAHKKRNPGIPTRGVLLFGLSLGNLFIQYFFNYLRAELGERGLERWADEHIHGLILGGAPFLGAVGPVKSIMTGETMGLPFSSAQSREMYLTFGGMPWMFPFSPKAPHLRHAAMNHGEVDHPVKAIEVAMRNGTLFQPENGEIIAERGFFGKVDDKKLNSVQQIIDSWYFDDPIIGGGSPLEPWIPPKGIDNIICAYGVNMPTPVGYKFREQNDENYEETDVLLNDRGDIRDQNGEHVLPRNRRFATRKSGDGSVPYYSLSFCHSWFDSSAINITRVPAHRKYEEDDIDNFYNVDVFNASQLREIERRPHGFNTFYTKRWTEKHPDTGLQRIKSIQVWELDGIVHRDTLTDERVLRLFQSMMSRGERQSRALVGVYRRMIRNARDEIDRSGIIGENWIAEIAQEGASFSNENVPTSDADCYWDYANVECAWPRYCVYAFVLGDLHLSMSCRLRETPLAKDDPQLLLRETAVLNETLNVSDRVEWRIIYRDKDRGMFAPWVYVTFTFMCGSVTLGVVVYIIVCLYHDKILQALQSRSSRRRVEMQFDSSEDKRLEKSIQLLIDAVKELEEEVDEKACEFKVAPSLIVGSSSPNPVATKSSFTETVEDLSKRVRHLSQSKTRRLSKMASESNQERAQGKELTSHFRVPGLGRRSRK